MADVSATHAHINDFPFPVEVYTWTPLTAANPRGRAPSGGNLLTGTFRDRSIQIKGTPDSATIVVRGSLDGTNWFTLTEPDGTPLSFATTDVSNGVLKQIAERTLYTDVFTSGGGGSQSITAIMLCGTGKV